MITIARHEIRTALVALKVVATLKASGDSTLPTECAALASLLTARAVDADAAVCVFRIALPLETIVTPVRKPRKRKSLRPLPAKAPKPVKVKLAPLLNEYAGMQGWTLALARAEIDQRLAAAKLLWPAWDCGSKREVYEHTVKVKGRSIVRPRLRVEGGGRRIVEVVRHSSREPDELAVDILGGKLSVDRMIWAGVLAGDQRKHLGRRCRWVPAKPGQGWLEIVVYELPIRSSSVDTL